MHSPPSLRRADALVLSGITGDLGTSKHLRRDREHLATGCTAGHLRSTASGRFGDAARAIASSRMPDDVRFVVEKPFGSNAATARELHDEMVSSLGEHRLLVVDHFLAKASVENLLTVTTSNALF